MSITFLGFERRDDDSTVVPDSHIHWERMQWSDPVPDWLKATMDAGRLMIHNDGAVRPREGEPETMRHLCYWDADRTHHHVPEGSVLDDDGDGGLIITPPAAIPGES